MERKKILRLAALFILLVLVFAVLSTAEEEKSKTALLIVDVQDFYFPGGALPLMNPEAAAVNIGKLLKKFRAEKQLVVHVRHNAKTGADIHTSVKPGKDEKVFSKDEVNSFLGTGLLDYLKKNRVKRLVICGMQTHMCVEAAVRAGHDYGFECILVHDACAARDLKFKDKTIPAEAVHYSTLSTLSAYAEVIDAAAFLKKY